MTNLQYLNEDRVAGRCCATFVLADLMHWRGHQESKIQCMIRNTIRRLSCETLTSSVEVVPTVFQGKENGRTWEKYSPFRDIANERWCYRSEEYTTRGVDVSMAFFMH